MSKYDEIITVDLPPSLVWQTVVSLSDKCSKNQICQLVLWYITDLHAPCTLCLAQLVGCPARLFLKTWGSWIKHMNGSPFLFNALILLAISIWPNLAFCRLICRNFILLVTIARSHYTAFLLPRYSCFITQCLTFPWAFNLLIQSYLDFSQENFHYFIFWPSFNTFSSEVLGVGTTAALNSSVRIDLQPSPYPIRQRAFFNIAI